MTEFIVSYHVESDTDPEHSEDFLYDIPEGAFDITVTLVDDPDEAGT